MKKQLNILKNLEDGTLTIAYPGINLDNYKYITVEEFTQEVENADFWDDIDSEVYREALDEFGLNYDNYDDTDIMWSDFLKAVE